MGHEKLSVTCQQALRGALEARRERKESLQLRLWNLNICIEKVDAKCWLAEMTLVMTSLSLARVFQCLFTFALVSASRWLAESDSSVDGELQGNWRWNSNSREVVASSPSFSRPVARAPRTACSLAKLSGMNKAQNSCSPHNFTMWNNHGNTKTDKGSDHDSYWGDYIRCLSITIK